MIPCASGRVQTTTRSNHASTRSLAWPPVSTCPDHLPQTPDGRYFVHSGRLWRCSDPGLSDDERQRLTGDLMDARRDVGAAKRASDEAAERAARDRVHRAKVALGERGPTWWDGDDHNRKAPKNTPYADWWAGLPDDQRAAGGG